MAGLGVQNRAMHVWGLCHQIPSPCGGTNLPLAPAPPISALPCPQKYVFYAAMSPLVAFYILFTAVLYPMHSSLHLNGFYAATAPLVPHGLHGLLKGGCGWRKGPIVQEVEEAGGLAAGGLRLCGCKKVKYVPALLPAVVPRAITHPPDRTPCVAPAPQ